MQDPCIGCLIKVCCSSVCPPKDNYIILVREAEKALKKHMYSVNGNRRKHIPKKIEDQYNFYSEKLAQNIIDSSKIVLRDLERSERNGEKDRRPN